MDQQELYLAWQQEWEAWNDLTLWVAEEEEEFGDEPWEEGPQTPPIESPMSYQRLVHIGGGLADEETDSDMTSSVATEFVP